MLRHIKDLFHRPVVIQQIGPVRPFRTAYTEEFLGQIDVCLVLFPLAPYTVFQLNGDRVVPDLLDTPPLPHLYHRL